MLNSADKRSFICNSISLADSDALVSFTHPHRQGETSLDTYEWVNVE
jgi:hypothetical protein